MGSATGYLRTTQIKDQETGSLTWPSFIDLTPFILGINIIFKNLKFFVLFPLSAGNTTEEKRQKKI